MFSFSHSGGWALAVSLGLVLNTGAMIASAQFDPNTQFSAVANPNGVWNYGFEQVPIGSPFGLLTLPAPVPSAPGPSIDSWNSPAFGLVGVFHNGTAANQVFSTPGPETSILLPDEISMNSGPNDEFGVVEFSAPAAGNYVIQGTFEGVDTAGTLSQVYLLLNNAPVATGTVVGFGPGSDVPLSAGPFFLNVGDTLAYAAGGTPFNNSMTAILPGAQVAAVVPEPATVFIAAVAGIGLLGYRPKSKRFSALQR